MYPIKPLNPYAIAVYIYIHICHMKSCPVYANTMYATKPLKRYGIAVTLVVGGGRVASYPTAFAIQRYYH